MFEAESDELFRLVLGLKLASSEPTMRQQLDILGARDSVARNLMNAELDIAVSGPVFCCDPSPSHLSREHQASLSLLDGMSLWNSDKHYDEESRLTLRTGIPDPY